MTMEVPTQAAVIAFIEDACKRHEMAVTRFGRDATGEPQLLSSLKDGRSPSRDLLEKIRDFVQRKDEEAGFVSTMPAVSQNAAPASVGKPNDVTPAIVAACAEAA